MGRRIAALAIESGRFDVVAALEQAGHDAIGKDVGELAGVGAFGVKIGDGLIDPPDVLVDFSLPDGTLQWLDVCRADGLTMRIGQGDLRRDGARL